MKTGRPDLDAMLQVRSIPAGEPTFLLRGQDKVGHAAVRAWAALAKFEGAPDCLVEAALQQADEMQAWPVKKVPGADHLDRLTCLQLEYELSRRAWRGALSAVTDPAPPGPLVFAGPLLLADRRGFDAAQPRVRELEAQAEAMAAAFAKDLERLNAEILQLRAQLAETRPEAIHA